MSAPYRPSERVQAMTTSLLLQALNDPAKAEALLEAAAALAEERGHRITAKRFRAVVRPGYRRDRGTLVDRAITRTGGPGATTRRTG